MGDTDIELPDNPIVDILTAKQVDPVWLFPDLALQGALVCIAGEPGSGKSYLSYHLGLAIAAGQPALGGLIPGGEPRRVLYFDEENSEQDRNKYLQRCWYGLMSQKHDPDLGLLYENFWPVHFWLGGKDWFEKAAIWIEHVRPHVIIFDTATPCFNILNENDNGEATQVVKQVRELMRMTDPVATAWIMKHAKTRTEKGGRRYIRGAKAWQGMADAVIFQVKATGRPRRDGLNLTRMEPDKTRAFGLTRTIHITPRWTDAAKTGLALDGSYTASKDHKQAQAEEDGDLE